MHNIAPYAGFLFIVVVLVVGIGIGMWMMAGERHSKVKQGLISVPDPKQPDLDGTDFYRRYIHKAEHEHADVLKREWQPTPWVIDVHTGDRFNEMREWCLRTMGRDSSPMHGSFGMWKFANVTMIGNTWVGFETPKAMWAFQARFPDWPARKWGT